MCLCHYCSILGLFLGEILYAIQKVIQCAAIGSVFSCLMFSFTVMLMLGVGLGYNHCYVEIQKPNAQGWWRSDGLCSVFSCVGFSFTVMLLLGVGLGDNYCYVEIHKHNARGWWWSDGNDSQSDDSNMLKYDRGSSDVTPSSGNESEGDESDIDSLFEELQAKRSQNTSTSDNSTTEDTPLPPTMIVPLNSKNNILNLIRKIRRQGKNVTLQFIAK